jgi:hypothetical protein
VAGWILPWTALEALWVHNPVEKAHQDRTSMPELCKECVSTAAWRTSILRRLYRAISFNSPPSLLSERVYGVNAHRAGRHTVKRATNPNDDGCQIRPYARNTTMFFWKASLQFQTTPAKVRLTT